MSVKISDFYPQEVKLIQHPKDSLGEPIKDWENPYPALSNVWVRIVPPTFGTDRARREHMATVREDGDRYLSTIQHEIYLCFGGTDLEISVPRRDDDGRLLWDKEHKEVLFDEIAFDQNGNMSRGDFAKMIALVPTPVIDFWYIRTLEVAPHWATTF